MPKLLTGLWTGALAGAAGATALNIATYIDMTVRARPSSSTPEQLVQKVASDLDVAIPGSGEQRENRISGLGGLSGPLVGVAVGAAAGAARALGIRLPLVLSAPLIGAAAMASADVPLAAEGVSDPRTWSRADWAADAVPHLVFGLVTAVAIRAMQRR
jgi:hypothetical protein